MKIYELIKKLNTKVSVKYSDVLKTKKYYLSLYRAYMVAMYDKGYISDPTVFNKKEIFKNILDMNIQYLTGVTGKIELTEEYIGFALSKYKNNAEVSTFLALLLNVIRYRNISINIDKFHDDCDLSSSLKKKVAFNLVQAASRVYTKNGFDIDEGIYGCIYGIDTKVDFVSLNSMVYNVALKELGLEEIEGDKSLFVSDLSRNEEIKYCDLILNGLVKLDGDYSNILVSWLKNNKWSDGNKFSSQNEGLYNWVLYIKSNNTIEEQSKLLNSLIDAGKQVVGMKSSGFYVLEDNLEIKYPVGVFSVMSDYDEDDVLPDINRLEGYTGEVYSLEFLDKNGISYVGSPIELYGSDGRKAIFIDKEQTDMKDSISWFKYIGADISFDESYDCSQKFEQGRIESKLQEAIINAERGILISTFSNEDYKNITDSAKKNVIKSLE